MIFASKLTGLIKLSGLTGSKIAKTIRVDPSLISKWKRGKHEPVGNINLLMELSKCFASGMTTQYQLKKLAEMLPQGSGIRLNSRQDVTEAIFSWLNEDGEAEYRKDRPRALSKIAPADLSFSNNLAGLSGRHLVIRQVFEQFNPAKPDQSILFYSNDPVSWIQADIEFRDSFLENYPNLFDNVTNVKLILHNNATTEEYMALLQYCFPFIRNSTIEMVQIPRYRKELFTNTILIAGEEVAAASHSFSNSNNFMTNIYTEPEFIYGLSRDYGRLFGQCERLHTIETDVTALDLIDEESVLFLNDVDFTFLGNSMLKALMPKKILQDLLKAEYGVTPEVDPDRIIGALDAKFKEFLSRRALNVNMPLFSPEAVDRGEFMIDGLPANGQGGVSRRIYLNILEHLHALMDETPNLTVRFIRKRKHDHAIVVQPGAYFCAFKYGRQNVLYTSRIHNFVEAFHSFIAREYGEGYTSQAERTKQMKKLEAHIRLFGNCE